MESNRNIDNKLTTFYTGAYPPDHWINDYLNNDYNIVYFAVKYSLFEEYIYVLKLNPNDRRGYRTFVCYYGKIKKNYFSKENQFDGNVKNRHYTDLEIRGLLDVSNYVMQLYRQLDIPIVQLFITGNDAHSMIDDVVQLGNEKEPILLHSNIIGRGNPRYNYIDTVPLEGSTPGIEMYLREYHYWIKEDDKNQVIQTFQTLALEGDKPEHIKKIVRHKPKHISFDKLLQNKYYVDKKILYGSVILSAVLGGGYYFIKYFNIH